MHQRVTAITYVKLSRKWAAIGRGAVDKGNPDQARQFIRLAATYAFTVLELAAEAMALEAA